MATSRELNDMQLELARELDAYGATLATLGSQQQNLAGWVATLISLLMNAGVISRTERALADLVGLREQPCLFCGEVH